MSNLSELLFSESRNWLPKLPKLLPDKKSDAPKPPPPASSAAKPNADINNNSQAPPVTGNYNSNGGVLLKALHLIENEIFYSDEPASSKGHRIIEDALVYLNYTAYE